MKKQIFEKSLFILLIFVISSCNNSSREINKRAFLSFIETNRIHQLKAMLQTINEKAAFLNQQDSLGNTWLHYAVRLNNNEAAALFLINGADPNIMNNEELTPLAVARENNYHETATKIHEFQLQDWKLQADKFSEENLEYAILNDNTLIIEAFITNNIKLDSMQLSNDFSPLITALFANSEKTALLLIKNGANPNDQFDTRSVLAMAAMFNQPNIVKALLEKGADVNADDGTLITPIMFAAQEGYMDIVKLLLQHKADLSRKDKNGETAFDKAIKNNHKKIAEQLIVN